MKTTIICVGEAIIDFHAQEQCELKDALTFSKALGGAPANLAIGLSRLGVSTGFIGAVGDDPFGHFIVQQLQQEGIETSGVFFKAGRKTRLAFVSHDRSGEPDFAFWESVPADTFLSRGDIQTKWIANARVVHISSFLLLSPGPARLALWLAERAKALGTMVSFDPNIRMKLWPGRKRARALLRRMTRHATVFRGNASEGKFITGARSPEAAVESLIAMGPELVVLTEGARGCCFGTKNVRGFVPSFKVRTVDGTGCGDGFTAALLAGIMGAGKEIPFLTAEELETICRRANAVGAMVATKRGGATSMPSLRALERFLAGRK